MAIDQHSASAKDFLPTSAEEARARGWDELDIIFVSGDAYVDHPSFAASLLGRVLEAKGLRVGILAQPDWRNADAFRSMGPPRLFFAVSAGNMDSMINHYTANRKRRNQDAYSPGGAIELRPDRATNVYTQRCREAFPGIPVVAGGVEASLRRVAHYDWWSDNVRPSILTSSKADLVGYGMGEDVICQVADILDKGGTIKDCRKLRGVAYLLGAKEELPDHPFTEHSGDGRTMELPSFEVICEDKLAFAMATRRVHLETNPHNARRIVQPHGDRRVVINPPALPFSEAQLDKIYDLPYQRRPHPTYKEEIPAFTMIRDSITIMRGCFGGCTFCSITLHQGRTIQSRSKESIMAEVEQTAQAHDFKGTISDLGGPTANMYRMHCTKPEVEKICRRLSCVNPTICKLLSTDHGPTRELMSEARETEGVKRVHIASGIRTDLAQRDPAYLDDLAARHVGGHLKVAPEHASSKVLKLMKKPDPGDFDSFAERFAEASARAGKEQYLVPYFIAGHPGTGPEEMIELAEFLKGRGYKPRQVQEFIPAPMDIATCMHYAGLDPMTLKPVKTVRRLRDRRIQKAMMQFFEPSNWFLVHEALLAAGREDLIGKGPKCLIPAQPPAEAIAARKAKKAKRDGKGPPSQKSSAGSDRQKSNRRK